MLKRKVLGFAAARGGVAEWQRWERVVLQVPKYLRNIRKQQAKYKEMNLRVAPAKPDYMADIKAKEAVARAKEERSALEEKANKELKKEISELEGRIQRKRVRSQSPVDACTSGRLRSGTRALPVASPGQHRTHAPSWRATSLKCALGRTPAAPAVTQCQLRDGPCGEAFDVGAWPAGEQDGEPDDEPVRRLRLRLRLALAVRAVRAVRLARRGARLPGPLLPHRCCCIQEHYRNATCVWYRCVARLHPLHPPPALDASGPSHRLRALVCSPWPRAPFTTTLSCNTPPWAPPAPISRAAPVAGLPPTAPPPAVPPRPPRRATPRQALHRASPRRPASFRSRSPRRATAWGTAA